MSEHKIFKRKIYDSLLKWKELSRGRSAVLVEGARRVGKSTVVRQFAENEYRSYIFIDFTRASRKIIELFDDLSNLRAVFMELQLEYGVTLYNRESVIIFDEVQFCPRARQAIKHLVAEGSYDYIETGSLISIRKNVEGILIPSEEERLWMYPMDYEEFYWALGDSSTCNQLRETLRCKIPAGHAHRTLMYNLRLYMLVGGMPQAVAEYLETNNLEAVDRIKRNIIALYEEDFGKIDSSGRIGRLFDDIPAQLSIDKSRFIPSASIGRVSAAREDAMLSEMKASMTVNFCHHTMDPSNGLAMDYNKEIFKIYMGDTGLFVTLAFKDKAFAENTIYKKLLLDKLDANLGYLYENLAAQMLVANGRNLFYYTMPAPKNHRYEVDFLISDGNKITPLEIKSSSYRAHASLDAFCEKYSRKIKMPVIVYTKELKEENGILYIPFYLLPFINELQGQ